jgi:hypothetical protein
MPGKRSKIHAIGGRHGATCDEFLALLNEYVEGGVDPSVCKALEPHLAKCNPCRVVVDNIRKTISLYRNDARCELPMEFRDRMHSALRNCWRKHGPRKKRRTE